ncbi:MAG: response regulator [Terriglobales bacterium]
MGLPTRITVLCVEDEESQLKLRRVLFESAGFVVFGARTGSEALELFRANVVDLVVLDYWMAGMNGLAVATELKRLRPTTPIIVLSGWTSLPGETIGLVDSWFQKAQVQPDELLGEATRLVNQNSDLGK